MAAMFDDTGGHLKTHTKKKLEEHTTQYMGRFTCDQTGMKACELVGSYRQKSGVWDRQT